MPMHYVAVMLGAVVGAVFGYLAGTRRTDALRRALDEVKADRSRLQRDYDDLERGEVWHPVRRDP